MVIKGRRISCRNAEYAMSTTMTLPRKQLELFRFRKSKRLWRAEPPIKYYTDIQHKLLQIPDLLRNEPRTDLNFAIKESDPKATHNILRILQSLAARKKAMSQQLLLEISSATARSKGQARRRYQPALSEESRKAQRNRTRRERTKCKKTENAQQQHL